MRALATGMAGVLIGLYLAQLGLSAAAIGVVISAGLAGATVSVLVATLWGDRLGRRRMLLGLALLGALGGAAAALTSGPLCLAASLPSSAWCNGMGRDRGAALVLEQAILPAHHGRARPHRRLRLVQPADRHRPRAGRAAGGAAGRCCRPWAGWTRRARSRCSFVFYAALHALAAAALRAACRRRRSAPRDEAVRTVAPRAAASCGRSRRLFGLDAVAGGFLGRGAAVLLLLRALRRLGGGDRRRCSSAHAS
ncbi:MAG: hypothetical protein MZW92_17785 [Comamonadaceae bacterium]|nr:hypothetical protein [Comamonadaceae bacterium]